MTPQERLALALQYQKQRDLGSALPSTPAENAARPVQEPEQSWLDKLSEAASGVGYGLGQQVEGLGQMARHPLDTLHSIAVGAGKAMDNPSAAAQAAWEGLKQSAGEAVSSPFNLGQAVGANVNINPRKIAAMLESPAVRELTVYHGTPHQFPATEANPLGEFDASKIGTGEGAQAYGHGIYLAQNPAVAKDYQFMEQNWFDTDKAKYNGKTIQQHYDQATKDQERAWRTNNKTLEEDAKARLSFWENVMTHVHPEKVVNDALADPTDWPQLSAYAKKIDLNKFEGIPNSGSLYHADLPDEMIDRMLDWDKRISDQPDSIKAAWESWQQTKEAQKLKKQLLDRGNTQTEIDKMFANPTGKTVHNWIYEGYGSLAGGENPKVAKFLQNQGVLGVKYEDAGSRGQGGTGTRNFVVFPGEEKKVKILERK